MTQDQLVLRAVKETLAQPVHRDPRAALERPDLSVKLEQRATLVRLVPLVELEPQALLVQRAELAQLDLRETPE